jgi:hypothetical protein
MCKYLCDLLKLKQELVYKDEQIKMLKQVIKKLSKENVEEVSSSICDATCCNNDLSLCTFT